MAIVTGRSYSGPGRELAALVAEQAAELAREDRTAKLPRHRGEVRFSELPEGTSEGLPALAPPRQWALYLGGSDAHEWDAVRHPSSVGIFDPCDKAEGWHLAEHFATTSYPIRCPVCLGRPLPPGWYCLACDRAGLDRADEDPADPFQYRGLDVNALPEWDYINKHKLARTVYRRGVAALLGGRR